METMTLLYLLYGLALFALGLASLVYPTDASKMPLARQLWKLGVFGISNAALEWMHMLQSAGAVDVAAMTPLRTVLIIGTFAFLLEFALGLLGVTGRARFLPLALSVACVALGFTGTSHELRASTFARYLLGLPGSALAALGMVRHLAYISESPAKYAFRARLLAGCFFVYALTAGLVVAREDATFFPASVFNETTFDAIFGFPVQLLRLLVATCAAYATVGLLEVFRHEAVEELRRARDHLEARVAERTAVLEDLNRKLASEMREREGLEVRLRFSDRMAAVGTLAAGMAHEINNPLTYVLLNLEMLRKQIVRAGGGSTDGALDGAVELSEAAHEGAKRIRDIVSALRIFSRGDEAPRQAVDVRDPLRFALGIAANELKHRARLVTELGEVGLVVANPGRLGQVFLNLLINATQAIPTGHADENTITVRTGMTGETVFVEVEDTGAGIPEDARAHIFDPFFTTKEIGVGTGLGLWICHAIVDDLGGRISLATKIGEGTRFRVELPEARDADAPEVPAQPDPVVARRLRVLVIDDEPAVVLAIRRGLEHAHEVDGELSASRALSRIEAGERFDAVVCDLLMPEMTGMDFFRALSALDGEQARRVVFMTAGAFTDEARAFLEEVPNRRVAKPLSIATLEEALGGLT